MVHYLGFVSSMAGDIGRLNVYKNRTMAAGFTLGKKTLIMMEGHARTSPVAH